MGTLVKMKICIIQAGLSDFSGSFIKAHEELISGEKVVLSGAYPYYVHKGRTIRYFYSLHPLRKKLLKLLPHYLYHKWVTLWEECPDGIHDAIAGFFKQHKVEVILAEFGFHGACITPHAKRLGIPLIVHFHGHDAHRDLLIEPYKPAYREMFSYASKIVSVSHFMTEKLIALGAPPEKIVYNPYGPRPEFYSNLPDYSSNTILSVGRFTDIKAPAVTLCAFRRLLSLHPEVRLMMVGTGELLECCKSLARAWRIDAQVTFTGGMDHSILLPLFSNACMFVQHSVTPSYGDAEGTPNTILEAGAAALPVVSTRHAGIVDAVRNEETGILVDEYDAEGMAQAMNQLFSNRNLCEVYGTAAKQHIEREYNIERHIGILNTLIQEVRSLHK